MVTGDQLIVCTCRSGGDDVARDIERLNAYQLLAMLFKRKRALLKTHILNLSLSHALGFFSSSSSSAYSDDSTVPSSTPSNTFDSNCVKNKRAFESLLADFDIPTGFSGELLNFNFASTSCCSTTSRQACIQSYTATPVSFTSSASSSGRRHLGDHLELAGGGQSYDLGQLVVALLTPAANTVNERLDKLRTSAIYTIRLRNRLLAIVDELISSTSITTLTTSSIHMCHVFK